MSAGAILLLALLLACPLMMVFMHRGGHGAHGAHEKQDARAGHGCGHDGHGEEAGPSLEELRRQREELDARIEELERAEAKPRAPVAG